MSHRRSRSNAVSQPPVVRSTGKTALCARTPTCAIASSSSNDPEIAAQMPIALAAGVTFSRGKNGWRTRVTSLTLRESSSARWRYFSAFREYALQIASEDQTRIGSADAQFVERLRLRVENFMNPP